MASSGPAPVMKLGAAPSNSATSATSKDQKFSYGAWIKAGRKGSPAASSPGWTKRTAIAAGTCGRTTGSRRTPHRVVA